METQNGSQHNTTHGVDADTWHERWKTEKQWREHFQARAKKAETVALAAVHFIDYLMSFREGRDMLASQKEFYEVVKAYFPDIAPMDP